MLNSLLATQYRSEPHLAPAMMLEEKTGIQGIGRVYRMPANQSAADIEERIVCLKQQINRKEADDSLHASWNWAQLGFTPTEESILSKLAQKFCELNPELDQVDFDHRDVWESYTFCLGVTSGFNPSDIEYFLKEDRSTPKLQKENLDKRVHGYIGELSYRLDQLFGGGNVLQFIPSPETADYINTMLDHRYGPDPVASLPPSQKIRLLESVNRSSFAQGPAGAPSLSRVLLKFFLG